MPELPDLTVVSEAFEAILVGRPIVAAVATAPLAVRGTPAELVALEGQRVGGIRRRGKFLIFDLARDRIVVNPMLTGRFQLARPGAPRPSATALILRFGHRTVEPATEPAAWTQGTAWMPGAASEIEVRYRDPTQMGKVYLLPADTDRAVPGMASGELGPDADAPDLDIETWRLRIRPYRGQLKNVLRDQSFVAGLGNAYSDEVLHAARLLPMRSRTSLAPEEIDELYRATRQVVADAQQTLRARVPPTFEKQVRDFLAVHGHGGEPCPRCGTRISEIKGGGHVTDFCRGCQR